MTYRKVFEELGMLEQETSPNPFTVLGIDPSFAQELIREDPSGDALRVVAGGMAKALATLYHPDVRANPEAGRDFVDIDEAKRRIAKASPSSLSRWARTERSVAETQRKQLEADRRLTVEESSRIFEAQVESVDHPRHFRRFHTSNGVLVNARNATFLLRPNDYKSGKLFLGKSAKIQSEYAELVAPFTKDISFADRMFAPKEYFGQGRSQKFFAFIEGGEGMYIYDGQYKFVADASALRQQTLAEYYDAPKSQQRDDAIGSFWLRDKRPHLVSFGLSPKGQIDTLDVMEFNEVETGPAWDVPGTVIGSLANDSFVVEATRVGASAAQAAIEASADVKAQDYPYKMGSFATSKLFEQSTEYSPLCQPNHSVLLYDSRTHQPIATDLSVVGLLSTTN